MDLKELKNLFFNFLKQFNEKELYLLMDYLGSLIEEYEKDYSKFFDLINKKSNKKLNLFENLMLSIEGGAPDQPGPENAPESPETSLYTTNISVELPTGTEIKNEPEEVAQTLEFNLATPAENLKKLTKPRPNKYKKNPNDTVLNPIETNSTRTLRKRAVSQGLNYKEIKKNSTSLMDQTTINSPQRNNSDESRNDSCSLNKSTKESPQTPSKIKIENNGRYKFNLKARIYLHKKYEMNRYPDSKEIQRLATKTKLRTNQIFMWFKDMRRKHNHTNPVKFGSEIVDVFLKYYAINKYPTNEEFEEMSTKTNLARHQVVQWFQDKRYRSNHTMARARYSKEDIDFMTKKFQKIKYPKAEELQHIATKTQLTTQQIYAWFKNKRKKQFSLCQTK